MSGSLKRGVRLLLLSASLVPLMCHADSAAVPLHVVVVVPPVFRIIHTAPVAGGHELRVWTNMRRVRMTSREYTFNRVGEATIFVPASVGTLIVHGL